MDQSVDRLNDRVEGLTGDLRQIGNLRQVDHPEEEINETNEPTKTRKHFADIGGLLGYVGLGAYRDCHQPGVAKLFGAVDGAGDLLHLPLELNEFVASFSQGVDHQLEKLLQRVWKG